MAGRARNWSEAFTHLPKVADDIAIIRSMTTEAINHAPGQIFMNTGSVQFGRPSFGAWVTYGLVQRRRIYRLSSCFLRRAAPAAGRGIGAAGFCRRFIKA